MSFTTADTPLKQMMTMVKGMDSKLDSTFKEIKQTVSKTKNDVIQMRQCIKDKAGNEIPIAKPMSSDHRADRRQSSKEQSTHKK